MSKFYDLMNAKIREHYFDDTIIYSAVSLLNYMQEQCPGPYSLFWDHDIEYVSHPHEMLRIKFLVDENNPEVLMFKLKWL